MATRPQVESGISYAELRELDEILERLNLRRKSVPNDGNSFFSAVSHQLSLLGKNIPPQNIRQKCIEYLRMNDKIGDILWWRDSYQSKDVYLLRNMKDGVHADEIMMQATSAAIGFVINIISITETLRVEPYTTPLMGKIYVAKINGISFISLEGTPNMEEGVLPRLFSLRDRDLSRGILKKQKSPGETPSKHLFSLDGDKQFDQTGENGVNSHGSNPFFNGSDDFFYLPGDDEILFEKPLYDRFESEPPEDEQRTSTPLLKFATKTFKFFSYFVFGSMVLGSGLVSKASLMVLINSAKPLGSKGLSDPDPIDHGVLRVWSFIILLVTMLVPEVMSMTYSLYRIIMKPESDLDLNALLWGLLWEVSHAIGESILILRVFPHLDATFALLSMPLIAIVPIIFHVHSKYSSIARNNSKCSNSSEQYRRIKNLLLAVSALILQLGGIVSMFAGFFFNNGVCDANVSCTSESYWFCFLCPNYTYIWAVVGIFLTSMRYWENFVAGSFYFTKTIKISSWRLHNKLDNTRFKTSFVYSFVKCLIMTGMTFFVFVVLENKTYMSTLKSVEETSTDAYTGARYSNILSLFKATRGNPRVRGPILQHLWYVFAVQTCGSFVTFFMGRVACITMIQREAFTFPLLLITPTLAALSATLGVYKNAAAPGTLRDFTSFFDLSAVREIRNLRYYIDWNNVVVFSVNGDETQSAVVTPAFAAVAVIIGLLVGYVGIVLITFHLWENPINRLERMEMLFVKPLYGAPLIDQVLLLNRRQYEQEYSVNKQKKDEEDEKIRRKEEENKVSTTGSVRRRKSSRIATISRGHQFIPRLFLCATMWHETEEEMTQILTSLMRVDRYQGSNKENAIKNKDYYNFQVHIMFDDAMERTKDRKQPTTNKYVNQLCNLIPLSANKVELGRGYDLPAPVIYPTPYGGRLEFVMPHGNLMIVHLKDKEKIRHRKRWSQCMYMYYILGYLQATKKAYKLEDIFLLALDGDVDFQPKAISYLLDRMKKNPDVGAACGRIHPTGSGPVVWFQKFEYAVGHWFQKTAEHVLGCVLCSPGCFSLFRGSALVDVNVLNDYTTKATKARHYVQWDQGEDRWLCTLLLKRGWRIEYCAASDSFTFAPEDFKEFYNQRRRWGPSTMANIFDILMDAKLAVKRNDYISWGYIAYQLGLMVSSLLGPATVIMVVQGSFQYVFQWSATVCLIVSLIPVIVFIIFCHTTSADTQIVAAEFLTVLYALVMMAVIVGIIGSFATNLFLDPNNIFMITLVGLYAFTGILHPQEIMCLIHGFLYYLCVPSAFILLMVYSLTNLNNVSWGTREVKKPNEDGGVASEQKEVGNKNTKQNLQLGPSSSFNDPSSFDAHYSCKLGNLCQCALSTIPKPVSIQPDHLKPLTTQPHRRQTVVGFRRPTMAPQSRQVTEKKLENRMSVSHLRKLSTRLGSESITTSKLRRISTQQRRISQKSKEHRLLEQGQGVKAKKAAELGQELLEAVVEKTEDYEIQSLKDYDTDDDEKVEPERMKDEDEEMLYWIIQGPLEDGFIKYLDDDERDFWKYMIQHYLYPLEEDKEEKDRIKNDLKTLRNNVTKTYYLMNALWLILNFALQLTIADFAIVIYINGSPVSVNPVSFFFLLFFLVILIIQFGCMLVHRWSTALHLLAVTSLKWNDKQDEIKNVKPKDLNKADELNSKKKNRGNGQVFGGGKVRDPLDREFNGGTNFSMIKRDLSSAHNCAFREDDDPEETTISEDNASEEKNEQVASYTSFSNNQALRAFGSVNKQYLTAEDDEHKRIKNSDHINMNFFNENENRGKKSVFSSPAVEDLLDKKMQTQVHIHHLNDDDINMTTLNHVRFHSHQVNEKEEENTAC